MALSNVTIFEVRTTGSDTNGGGFVTGASGTDLSIFDTSAFSGSNLASSNGTTNPSIVTSASHSFVSTDVGNMINIPSGTNWIPGVYQIVSAITNAATLDRAAGTTTAITNGVWAIGGAFATIGKALNIMTVTGMQTYVKGGTYSISAGLTTPAGISPALGICRVIGYSTTRGDNGRPTIQASASMDMYTESRGGFRLENFILDANSKATTKGAVLSGGYSYLFNCKVMNCTGNSINPSGSGANYSGAINCEITAQSGTGSVCNLAGTASTLINCYIHDNTTSGAMVSCNATSGVNVEECIIANNTNAGSDGIFINFLSGKIRRNVIYNNGRDGIRNATNYGMAGEISNNIIVSNGGFGLNLSIMSPLISDVLIHHNAYFNNTLGSRNNTNAGTGDVTLTGVPFVNAAAGNFALNNTAGQGNSCRNAGFPGILLAGGTGYIDIGALQAAQPTVGYTGGG